MEDYQPTSSINERSRQAIDRTKERYRRTPPKGVSKLKCDGIPRYTVKGFKSETKLTYSQAWDKISRQSATGKGVTPAGFRRLKALNQMHNRRKSNEQIN